MIFAKPTKYGAGIEIFGDYHDFTDLHETIHRLADENGPLDGGQGEFALSLAYEVRHAYQGDRGVHKFIGDIYHSESAIYYSFKMLWPIFLVQLGLLRWAAGFQPTTREYQANLFRLEACAESALISYDPFVGRRCLEWLTRFQWFSDKYLLQYVQNCSLQYVTVGKAGKIRFKELPEILRMLSPFSKEYRAFEEYLQSIAKEKGCRPEDLTDIEEWPEFKW
jgi:hypothetical protein